MGSNIRLQESASIAGMNSLPKLQLPSIVVMIVRKERTRQGLKNRRSTKVNFNTLRVYCCFLVYKGRVECML
ncbi:hypothetical protein BCL90_0026 [Pedobacter alluvionis]|uniref:Uncharacterized protein n=1 Tax=Pedobacter alluvionis TaxID=475253 RepID=A0A497YBD3_9SPHI|nr:hypothetical protein BCL90_0026 [Pedobacter alluvionis]